MTPQTVKETIEWLYDYGETASSAAPLYLEELGLVACREDRLVITETWIRFTGRLKCVKQDIVNALLCFEPSLLEFLLARVYQDARIMAERGDVEALFEFVDGLPLFAERLLELTPRPPLLQREGENRAGSGDDQKPPSFSKKRGLGDEFLLLLEMVFGTPYPQYGAIMQILKKMQRLEEVEDRDCAALGKMPDEIWLPGRKISSNIALKSLDEKNRFTLTPYHYNERTNEKEDIKKLLSFPWKLFLVRLGLVIHASRDVEPLLALRPENESEPFTSQTVLVSLFDRVEREREYGELNNFVYDWCQDQGLSLFPDCPPNMQQELFTLIGEGIFTYRDGEYQLEQGFADRAFNSEFLLVNRTKNLRMMIKSFVEKCRGDI